MPALGHVNNLFLYKLPYGLNKIVFLVWQFTIVKRWIHSVFFKGYNHLRLYICLAFGQIIFFFKLEFEKEEQKAMKIKSHVKLHQIDFQLAEYMCYWFCSLITISGQWKNHQLLFLVGEFKHLSVYLCTDRYILAWCLSFAKNIYFSSILWAIMINNESCHHIFSF